MILKFSHRSLYPTSPYERKEDDGFAGSEQSMNTARLSTNINKVVYPSISTHTQFDALGGRVCVHPEVPWPLRTFMTKALYVEHVNDDLLRSHLVKAAKCQ